MILRKGGPERGIVEIALDQIGDGIEAHGVGGQFLVVRQISLCAEHAVRERADVRAPLRYH